MKYPIVGLLKHFKTTQYRYLCCQAIDHSDLSSSTYGKVIEPHIENLPNLGDFVFFSMLG